MVGSKDFAVLVAGDLMSSCGQRRDQRRNAEAMDGLGEKIMERRARKELAVAQRRTWFCALCSCFGESSSKQEHKE